MRLACEIGDTRGEANFHAVGAAADEEEPPTDVAEIYHAAVGAWEEQCESVTLTVNHCGSIVVWICVYIDVIRYLIFIHICGYAIVCAFARGCKLETGQHPLVCTKSYFMRVAVYLSRNQRHKEASFAIPPIHVPFCFCGRGWEEEEEEGWDAWDQSGCHEGPLSDFPEERSQHSWIQGSGAWRLKVKVGN